MMPQGIITPFIEKIRSSVEPINTLQDFKENGLRSAAVLIPVVFTENQWYLLFIHRAEVGEFHRGEVAFPGGGREPGDTNLISTALRETQEELGIDPKNVDILGYLPPSGTISRYWVTPILGVVMQWPQNVKVNSTEVSHYFLIPFSWLENPSNWKEHELDIPGRGKVLTVDYSLYQGEHLWGITARITNSLLNRMEKR